MDSQSLVVFCTCPDQASAEHIAVTVVEERLAACVNILPGLTSVYRWREQMQRDTEFLLLVKTSGAVYPLLEARILELHPYDMPEVIALPVRAGSSAYLDWIAANTGASA